MTEESNVENGAALITGVAGFIGSQLADYLLAQGGFVIGVDDLSRGCEQNLRRARSDRKFEFHRIDLADESEVFGRLLPALKDRQITDVWHLAANSDISAGIRDLHVDLKNTFMTTVNTLLLMRELGIGRLAFASTSAVYGYRPEVLTESTGPLLPISNYGAMKLASEALISAAVESHLDMAWIFRFPNVVGPRLTHGVIYDLLVKLSSGRDELEVLGDGTQKKAYLHSSDLLQAMIFIRNHASNTMNLFNIGPQDDGATVAQIAESVLEIAGSNAKLSYKGGDRGWVGDVPRFRYSVAKLNELGWRCATSSLDSIRRAIYEAISEAD